jgi:hypothetical protein
MSEMALMFLKGAVTKTYVNSYTFLPLSTAASVFLKIFLGTFEQGLEDA